MTYRLLWRFERFHLFRLKNKKNPHAKRPADAGSSYLKSGDVRWDETTCNGQGDHPEGAFVAEVQWTKRIAPTQSGSGRLGRDGTVCVIKKVSTHFRELDICESSFCPTIGKANLTSQLYHSMQTANVYIHPPPL